MIFDEFHVEVDDFIIELVQSICKSLRLMLNLNLLITTFCGCPLGDDRLQSPFQRVFFYLEIKFSYQN
jgi:hypothetical protein